jgi:hypothetical protein
MPADLLIQEAIDQNGSHLIYARASCDWKSSMPKHSLDGRRNKRRTTAGGQSGRPDSRFKRVWGALNGTFVATIIGVAGAMGAAIIPTYLDSSSSTPSASSSPSPRSDPPPFGYFPQRAGAPPLGGPGPHGVAPSAGNLADRQRLPCRRGATYLQHFAASQGSSSQRGAAPQPSPSCQPCPTRGPGLTYGPRLPSRPPST